MPNEPTNYEIRTPEPIPENLRSVQPGGGVCYQIELAWGKLRRWYLRTFRAQYVTGMAEKRQGSADGAPYDVLDPRDLKYCRNQCSAEWRPEDDPFAWRDRLPFARWGLAELWLLGSPFLAITTVVALFWWYLAWIPAIPLVLVAWFFRDPPRKVPEGPGLLVSPADGKISEITRIEHDPFIGGPAVRVGIFLSIFNVHLNRVPTKCRVISIRYSPGKFLNALDPQSAIFNENIWIGVQEEEPPYRPMIVRPIAGAIARRIVCPLRPGDRLDRGGKIGMIKLGSRTELIVPDEPGLKIEVTVGQKVKAGSSVLGKFEV